MYKLSSYFSLIFLCFFVQRAGDNKTDRRKKKATKIVSFDNEMEPVSSSLPGPEFAGPASLPFQRGPDVAVVRSRNVQNIGPVYTDALLSANSSTSSFDITDTNLMESARTVIRSSSSASLPANFSDCDLQATSAEISSSIDEVTNCVTTSSVRNCRDPSSSESRTVPDCSTYSGCFELELTMSTQPTTHRDGPRNRNSSSASDNNLTQADTDSIGSCSSMIVADQPRLSSRLTGFFKVRLIIV